jgi:cysteine synthase A
MQITDGFPGTVGNTPLIRIPSLSAATGCTILGKAEHLNPGGSVKDRAARRMIEVAEAAGTLVPGERSVVVEGTAGNTGIGLAFMCRARGYRCIIVMPNNQSDEKVSTLRALGAEVELVEPAPFANAGNYYHVARRRAEELTAAGTRCFWADQFENTANSDAHVLSTGPELWDQTDGSIDGFICSAGTGGTIGGISSYLKSKNDRIVCAVIDPPGSSLHNYVTTGSLDASGSSFTEGIGIRRITANFSRAKLDRSFFGSDEESIEMVYWLLAHDGLFVGGSAALNCVGAVKLARALGPGKTIATILCDGAGRYQSKLFSDEWLEEKGFRPGRATDLSFVTEA